MSRASGNRGAGLAQDGPEAAPRARRVVLVVVFTAYLVLARVGLTWSDWPTQLWLATGVSMAALLLSPLSEWPLLVLAVALASVLACRAAGYDWTLTAGFTVANVLEPLVGAGLIRRVRGENVGMCSVPDVLAYVGLGAVAGGLVGAVA